MKTSEVKDYIKQSLFILMDKNSYEKISMSMISVKSGVSRRTIYRYFKNKDDILMYYKNELLNDYYSTFKKQIEDGCDVFESSFKFIADNSKFFELAYKNNLNYLVIEVLEDVIRTLIQCSPKEKFAELNEIKFLDVYIAFCAGGCNRILEKWLNEDKKQSPEEILKLYRTAIEILDYRTKKRKRNSIEDQIIYKCEDGNVPAIVSEELWDKANEILSARTKGYENNNYWSGGVKYPFSSKIYCKEHNTNFQRSHGSIRKKRPTWSCGLYLQYRLSSCNSPIIAEKDLYNIFLKIMVAI